MSSYVLRRIDVALWTRVRARVSGRELTALLEALLRDWLAQTDADRDKGTGNR